MGDVGRELPVEIPQVPFDRQAGIVAQHDLGRICRLVDSSQLGQRRRPYRERLQMIGIDVQGLARP